MPKNEVAPTNSSAASLIQRSTASVFSSKCISWYTRLVALPLWRLGRDSLLDLLWHLAGELSGDLGEGGLVGAHLDGELLEVTKLVGETNGVTVDEDVVTGLVTDLVDLKDTLLGHGSLKLVDEVLTDAEWPPLATGVGGLHKLVDHTVDLGDLVVDLDLIRGEDSWDLGVRGETLAWGWLDTRETGDGVEEVTEGREVLALTLGGVGGQIVTSGDGVGLEGKVVIGDGAVVALDGLVGLIGVLLDGVGDLNEHVLLDTGEVGAGSVLNLLGTGLTDLDGLGDLVLHIGTHGFVLGADELAVLGRLLSVLADDASEHLQTLLHLGVVGRDGVGEGGETVSEVLLGSGDTGLGVGGVLRDGLGVLAIGLNVGLLDGGHVGVELLRGIRHVLAGGLVVGSSLGTDAGDLSLEKLVELLELLGGGTLVLVENLTELATSLNGLRLVRVHKGLNALELTLDVTVDLGLGGPVVKDGARDDLDIASEAGVHLLNSGGDGSEGGGEVLAGVDNLLGSLLAGGVDGLDGLLETRVIEGGLLGDGVVHVLNRAGELLVELSTVLGHVPVDGAKLVIRLLLGSLEGGDNLLVGLGEAIDGSGLKSEKGAVHGGNAVGELLLGDGLLVGDLLGELVTALLGKLGGGVLLLVHGDELGGLLLDGGVEVILGLLTHGADGEEKLLLHLSASLLRVETETLDLGVGVLGELGDLGGDLGVESGLGLLVELHEVGFDTVHAVLTLGDSGADSRVELGLVSLHEIGQIVTTLLGLDGVIANDTGELVELTLELLVVVSDLLVEVSETSGEVGLGTVEGVGDGEDGLTVLVPELTVSLGLGGLGLGDG